MGRRKARAEGWFGCRHNREASNFHPSLKWCFFWSTFPILWEITFSFPGQFDCIDGTLCQEPFFLSCYALNNLEKNSSTWCHGVYTPMSHTACTHLDQFSAEPQFMTADSPSPCLSSRSGIPSHTLSPCTRLCFSSVVLDWLQPLLFPFILSSNNNSHGHFSLYFSECKSHFFSTFSQ